MRDRRARVGLGYARSMSEGEGVVLCDLRETVQESRGGLGVVQEGADSRDFGKRFTNFLGVNRFSNFYT